MLKSFISSSQNKISGCLSALNSKKKMCEYHLTLNHQYNYISNELDLLFFLNICD